MKTTNHTVGTLQFEDSDLLDVFRNWAKKNSQAFTLEINAYLKQKGFTVKKIQKSPDLTTVLAEYESVTDEGVRLAGSPRPPIQRASNSGFTRKYVGFYSCVIDIIHERHNLHEISFDDLYIAILELEDAKGVKLFWKKDQHGVLQPMEKSRFMQYLTPSQIDPIRNPKFRGISIKPDGTGLFW